MVKNPILNRQKLRELGKAVFIRVGALPFILVAIFVIFGVWNPAFLGPSNVVVVSRTATYIIIVTVAQMLALISGGLDLSLGGSITLISVITATVMVALKAYPGVDIFAGVLAGIGVGTLMGVLNGFCIGYLGIAPFVVTFATGQMAQGASLILTDGGVPIFGLPGSFEATMGAGKVLGVPVPIMVAIILIGAMYFIVTWTRFGRYLYALGGSRTAALVMGIPVRRYTFLTYLVIGILVGIAGVMMTARIGCGEATIGQEMALLSITAAVMGGVSLYGGEGKLYGAILGAVTITFLRVGMDMARIGSFVQMAAVGAVLITVIIIDRYRRQLV